MDRRSGPFILYNACAPLLLSLLFMYMRAWEHPFRKKKKVEKESQGVVVAVVVVGRGLFFLLMSKSSFRCVSIACLHAGPL